MYLCEKVGLIFFCYFIHLTASFECCDEVYVLLDVSKAIRTQHSINYGPYGIYIKHQLINQEVYYKREVTFKIEDKIMFNETYYLVYYDYEKGEFWKKLCMNE